MPTETPKPISAVAAKTDMPVTILIPSGASPAISAQAPTSAPNVAAAAPSSAKPASNDRETSLVNDLRSPDPPVRANAAVTLGHLAGGKSETPGSGAVIE